MFNKREQSVRIYCPMRVNNGAVFALPPLIAQPVKTKSRIEMRLDDIQTNLTAFGVERRTPGQLFATATDRPAMETHWPELAGDCILI